MSKKYDQFLAQIRDYYDLRSSKAVLEWDQQTHMPPKGNDARSRQMALLAELAHQKISDPRLGELLEECRSLPGLNPEQKAMLREAKRERDRAVKLPAALVRELANTTGRAHVIWATARKENAFNDYAPVLKKIIQLKMQEAKALGYPKDGVPYDALLDQFEPGATVTKINGTIEKTRDMAIAALAAIGTSKKKPKKQLLARHYPIELQEKFCHQLLVKLNYDLEAGRMDRSLHPFSTSFDPRDARVTTRYNDHYLSDSIFSIVHEVGHALYEQGIPIKYAATPIGEAVSYGFHESQSRFWENQVGRSLPFWKHFFPKLRKIFPKALGAVGVDQFYFAANAVEPSFIRVDADEVTYNLHIVIRYELEQGLFSGKIDAADLPELWNEKMQRYLGIRPKKDAQGVLQDVHWSFGGFGYFPTYLLGNLYSAQWTSAMRRELDFDKLVAKGDLLPIKKWLNEKIHRWGKLYSAEELTQRISGESLNPEHFNQYLKEKYGPLYDVSW